MKSIEWKERGKDGRMDAPNSSTLPFFHSSPPRSALLTEDEMGLFVDYYQLTMGQADFDAQNDAIITANYYVRKIPQGQYLIAAGLEQVIHYILNLRFTDAALDWLAQRGDLHADYLASLKDFRFDGSVFAVPEGTPVFPNEPIINVTGRSRDVQLFETYLLCVMNFARGGHTAGMRVSSPPARPSSVVRVERHWCLQDTLSIFPTLVQWRISSFLNVLPSWKRSAITLQPSRIGRHS